MFADFTARVLNSIVLGDGSSDSGCCAGAAREERRHEVNDEEMSEGSAIPRVKGVCSQQTIQRLMSLVINAVRRQGETDGDGEVEKKSMANCRQCDRSKATGTVWHKEPEQQIFKKNVKVQAEAQKVKAGDEVSGP